MNVLGTIFIVLVAVCSPLIFGVLGSILGRWLAENDIVDNFFERLDDFIDKAVEWLNR